LVTSARAKKLKVGFWQVNSMYPLSNPRSLRTGILDLLNSGELESVYSSDNLEITQLKLIAPNSFLNSYYPLGYNWAIGARELVDCQSAKENWQARGSGIEELIALRFDQLGK